MEASPWVVLIVAVLSSTLISSLITVYFGRDKTEAETEAVEAETYRTWINSNLVLQEEIESLRRLRREDLQRSEGMAAEYEQHLAKMDKKYQEAMEATRSELSAEMENLRERIRALEAEREALLEENRKLKGEA